MYFKKIILFIYTLCAITSCGQHSNNKSNNHKKMEDGLKSYKREVMYNKIQEFKTRPLYTLQVNKNNCRVLISVNDIPFWLTFYKNTGESMALYLNNYILKSGVQNVTIQIYPKEGDKFIADNADVDLKLLYAKDKDDGVNTHLNLKKVELPEDIGKSKLPYFEIKIPFEAKVPWDYSKNLENAEDLSKIPDINEKILEKYKNLREMLVKGEGLSFLKEIENRELKAISYLYFTKNEILNDEQIEDIDVTISRLDVKNRKVYPIENYEFVFTNQNKLVLLRNKTTKDDLIGVEFDTEENGVDGSTKMLILYMPKGSNKLEVW